MRSAPRSPWSVGNVSRMTGGTQSDPNGRPVGPRPPGERAWQHPSEVGLATRGRTDRRRSTLLAAGVMLSGIGILVTGVLIGSTDGPESDGETVAPMDKLSSSVAHVTVVEDAGMRMVTGLVLDDDGNVLVPADEIEQGDEIWARCADGNSELVEVVGTDAQTNLAVVRLAMPAGSPAVAANVPPTVDAEVVTVHARRGTALSMRDGVVASTDSSPPGSTAGTSTQVAGASWFWAEVSERPEEGPAPETTDLSGGLMFDRGGRFVGMTTTPGEPARAVTTAGRTAQMSLVQVMPSEAAMRMADRIIAGG